MKGKYSKLFIIGNGFDIWQGLPDDCFSVLKAADSIDGGHDSRKEDAKWHVSYFSEADKKRIENVFKKIGFMNYELYQGIDACIKDFRR